MQREELEQMLKDIDGLGTYVGEQMAILPTEIKKKGEASGRLQRVKDGLVQLIEAHDQSVGALKHKIEARRAS